MEGLSAAASVIAVVGLAGQLLAGIKNITDFWSTMQDMPQDLSDAIHELRLLGTGTRKTPTLARSTLCSGQHYRAVK